MQGAPFCKICKMDEGALKEENIDIDNKKSEKKNGIKYTVDKMAKKAGVSSRSVSYAGEFTDTIEKIQEKKPDVVSRIVKGEIMVPRLFTTVNEKRRRIVLAGCRKVEES